VRVINFHIIIITFLFRRLIPAVTDWMSTILLHMVWPQCEFRMVLNVLHAAFWKRRTQKISPKICHLGTIPQLCRTISSQLRHVSTIGEKLLNSNISPTCAHNMLNFGPLAAEICWRVWGTPANFNGLCVLASLLHRRHSTEVNQLCTMFGRLLGWYAIYTFSWAFAP